MKKSAFLTAAILPFLATPVVSEEIDTFFTAIDTSSLNLDDRPYDYAIVGVVPGMTANEAREIIEEYTDTKLDTDEIAGTVSANARTANYRYTRSLRTPGATRLTQGNGTYEVFEVLLATQALEQTVVSINRRIRKPPESLPEPNALRAQLEETYGTPSRVEIEGPSMRLTYFWTDAGLIEDIEAVEETTIEHEVAPGDIKRFRYQPCRTPERHVEYEFKFPRNRPFMPGCTARFTVAYRTGPGVAELSFELRDFDLIRANREASDQQILDHLNNTEVTASDFDL